MYCRLREQARSHTFQCHSQILLITTPFVGAGLLAKAVGQTAKPLDISTQATPCPTCKRLERNALGDCSNCFLNERLKCAESVKPHL